VSLKVWELRRGVLLGVETLRRLVSSLIYEAFLADVVTKDEQRKSTEGRSSQLHGGPSEGEIAVSKVLEKLAEEKGTLMTSVA
jgi:hypothetical protein